ncbi:MAG: hypothetical protein COS19_09975, partial [Flavobacteriaceae bacterium CG02_land_8_20_14_3_00_34_13]
MKKITLCCFLLIAVCFSWQLQAQTYTGDNLGVPNAINNTLPPVVSNANMPLTGNIGSEFSIDNVLLNITHTWDGDMTIVLISPTGTNLTLAAGLGGSADNYTNTVFQDGNPSITTGSAPFTGTFSPQGGQLNTVFAGEPVNGNWALRITDCCGGDNGTLNNYQITFTDLVNISECSIDPPLPLGLGSGVTTLTTINVAQTGVIGTNTGEYVIDEIVADLQHTWANDLEIVLIAPSGTQVALSTDNGGSSGLDVQSTLFFRDDSPNNIATWTGGAPLANYRAEGGATAHPVGSGAGPGVDLNTVLAGQSINGIWTLRLYDDVGGDGGTIFDFCINLIKNTQIGEVPAIVCPLDIVI